jgi:prepilin signal peptidase PulO-like enzyme (type II secretory pathway)
LVLRGKCRYCGKSISIQYPLVEIATGLLFVLIFWHWPFGLWIFSDFGFLISGLIHYFYYLIISCFLIVIFVYDLKHYLILDKVIYPAIGIALAYQIINFQTNSLLYALFAALLASGFFASIVFASRGKYMGAGDIKLGFLMGLLLSFPQILTGLFLAFLFGAIIGIGMIILKKKTLKSEVPFGPFLVAGTFIAMFWGEQILNWYLRFL